MPLSVSTFLASLRNHVQTGAETRRVVLRELSDHLEDRTVELMDRGLPQQEAIDEAMRSFGNPRTIGAELSTIHNQGTLADAALSAAPHLMIASLFATHRWLSPEWLFGAFIVVIGFSVAGWLMHRAAWVYSWLGYAIFPLVLVGTVSIATLAYSAWSVVARGASPTDPWVWLLGIAVGVSSVILSAYLLVWVGKRDWVSGALLMLPVPLLSLALLAFDQGTFAADRDGAILFGFAAFSVAVVVRVSDRLVKIGLLGATLPIGFLLIAQSIAVEVRFAVALLASLPALLAVFVLVVRRSHVLSPRGKVGRHG